MEEILHKEEKKRVWDAVNRLKGQKKEVILLQYFGDFSQKEIAAMLKDFLLIFLHLFSMCFYLCLTLSFSVFSFQGAVVASLKDDPSKPNS